MAGKSSELRAEENALYKKGELLKGMIQSFLWYADEFYCGVWPNKCWQGYFLDQSNVNYAHFSQSDLFVLGP
jgi:hypothetical protein